MSPTGHFSSASGSTVWFVKKNVLHTMSHALFHGTSSSSTSMRISSGIASVGCVCVRTRGGGADVRAGKRQLEFYARRENGWGARTSFSWIATSARRVGADQYTGALSRRKALTVRELRNVLARVLEPAHDVRQARRRPEVLLLQS